MVTRRQFLRAGAVAGAGVLVSRNGIGPLAFPSSDVPRGLTAIPAGTLDPTTIPKYALPLVVPPAMPRTATIVQKGRGRIDYYEVAVRQFQQQILPDGMPGTTVWSYGSVNHPATFNYPAFTIEAKFNRPVRVKWINGLTDPTGDFLPHLLPVDPSLHWANPPGGIDGRDMRPTFASTPGRYTGPVPLVPHLHGGHNAQESDGYAEAWYLPVAGNIPPDFAAVGSLYDDFKAEFFNKWGLAWEPGTATFRGRECSLVRLQALDPTPSVDSLRSRSRFRTARSGRTDRCSTQGPGSFSMISRGLTSPAAMCFRSGIPNSSAPPWSSTAGLGPSWKSSRAATASAC